MCRRRQKVVTFLKILVAANVAAYFIFLSYTRKALEAEQLRVKKEVSEDVDPYKKVKRLPDIIVVGVMKCGTGSLIEMMRLHPNITAPKYSRMENKFYGQDDYYSRGEQYFIDLMPEATAFEMIVTKSPGLIDPGPGLQVSLYHIMKYMIV